MIRLLLLLICSSFSFSIYSQCVNTCGDNFIRNGDFETINEPDCSDPNLSAQLYLDFSPVADWIGGVQSTSSTSEYTPDYLSSNCTTLRPIVTCSGDGAIGFFSVLIIGNASSEYFQGQLTAPLEAGRQYCIEFEAASSTSIGSPSDGLDVFLVNDLVDQEVVGLNIPFTPAYSHPQGDFIPEACTVYSFNYTATGGEEWIVFGNKDADLTQIETGGVQAYVIIDNISLFEVDQNSPTEIEIVTNATNIGCNECVDLELVTTNLDPSTEITWTPNLGTGFGPFELCPDQDTLVIASAEYIGCGGQVDTISDTLALTYDCNSLDFSLSSDPSLGICLGECVEITIDNLVGDPVEFIWSEAGFSGMGPQNDCPNESKIYTLSIVSGSGDTVTRSVNIEVWDLPTVSIIPEGPFCLGSGDVQLNANPAGGTWSEDVDNSGVLPISSLPEGSYTAVYEFTDGQGCSASDTLSYEVIGSGLVDLSIPSNPLCSNQDPIMISSLPSGVDGIFEGPGVSITGLFDPSMVSDSAEINFIYGLDDCIDTAQITIQLIEVVPLQFEEISPFCLVDTLFRLSASPEGGSWSGSVDEAGHFNPELLGPGTFSAIYTVEDSECPQDDTLLFEITQAPVPRFANWISVFQLGDDNYDIEVIPGSLDGQFAGPGIIDSQQGLFSPSNAGTGNHQIVFEAAVNGCTVRIDSTLEVFGEWFVPNIFTPNGDGINDVFRVESLPQGDWTMQIFNRWGSLIFESRSPAAEGWDGTFRGQTLNPDVYVWSLKGSILGGPLTYQKGTVTLVE